MEERTQTRLGRVVAAIFSQKAALIVASLALLAFWCYWWKLSFEKDHLAGAPRTWIPRANWLGVDFQSNYHAARYWLAGGNPYKEPYGDPLNRPFIYSPLLFVLFSWCAKVTAAQAVVIWTSILAVLAGVGALVASATRRALGLTPLPIVFVLACVLLSTPVMFAMERGNCDMLIFLLVLVTAACLRKSSLPRDMVAGGCLALAAWIKIYPAVLVLGLFGARRPRAVLFLGLAYAGIGMMDLQGTSQHYEATKAYVGNYDIPFDSSAHPLTTHWKHLFEGTRFERLSHLPGPAGTAIVLLPGLLWATVAMFRCRNRAAMLVPYLLWMTAAATFAPPVSNDYNLFFLPLAALAIWDRRDPLIVHLMMAPLLLWWQPVRMPIGADLLFIFKLVGLYAVLISLTVRTRELSQGQVERETTSAPAPRPLAVAA